MPTFTLHFECYVQQMAFVEIEADDVEAAIQKASDIVGDVEDFEPDWNMTTSSRLYAVNDADGEQLAAVNLEVLPNCSAITWTEACLTDQWRNLVDPDWHEASVDGLSRDDLVRACQLATPSVQDVVLEELERKKQAKDLEASTPFKNSKSQARRL